MPCISGSSKKTHSTVRGVSPLESKGKARRKHSVGFWAWVLRESPWSQGTLGSLGSKGQGTWFPKSSDIPNSWKSKARIRGNWALGFRGRQYRDLGSAGTGAQSFGEAVPEFWEDPSGNL